MGFFDIFSAAPKAVDNVLDKDNGLITQLGGWINDQNLTEEEAIKHNAKTVDSVQNFVIATLSESTDRSKTRRAIAVMWIRLQAAIILMSCIAAPWNMDIAKFYFELGTSSLMITVTTAICIFFFGSHGLAKYKEAGK